MVHFIKDNVVHLVLLSANFMIIFFTELSVHLIYILPEFSHVRASWTISDAAASAGCVCVCVCAHKKRHTHILLNAWINPTKYTGIRHNIDMITLIISWSWHLLVSGGKGTFCPQIWCLKQEKWTSLRIWVSMARTQLWRTDDWVRACSKLQLFFLVLGDQCLSNVKVQLRNSVESATG